MLLHSLFGHELGHTALHTVGAGSILQSEVMVALQSIGPLSSAAALTGWLHENTAPTSIKRELQQFQSMAGVPFEFDDYYHSKWLDEIICDLFGLLLFGTGFAAAHQVYLRPMHSNPYEIGLLDATHPPYATRHKILVRAVRLLGWDHPVSSIQPYQQAEQALLDFVLSDPYDPWSLLVSDQQLRQAITGVRNVFLNYGNLGYSPPDSQLICDLVQQLAMRLPPIIAKLSSRGRPELRPTDITHTLYSGWVYSLGARHLTQEPLPFLETNMLCDHALLQQRAVDLSIAKRLR